MCSKSSCEFYSCMVGYLQCILMVYSCLYNVTRRRIIIYIRRESLLKFPLSRPCIGCIKEILGYRSNVTWFLMKSRQNKCPSHKTRESMVRTHLYRYVPEHRYSSNLNLPQTKEGASLVRIIQQWVRRPLRLWETWHTSHWGWWKSSAWNRVRQKTMAIWNIKPKFHVWDLTRIKD